MTELRFIAMPTDAARALQGGAVDAFGRAPEHLVSDGSLPCRHCLDDIAQGKRALLLAYRPFPQPQPYAETGPIFLHADACMRYDEHAGVPAMLLRRPDVLLRGYTRSDRIAEGTGRVVPSASLEASAADALARPQVVYLHVRSATNNCYQCRLERG